MANPNFNTQVASKRGGTTPKSRKPGPRVEDMPMKTGFHGVSMPGGTQKDRSAGVKRLQTYPQSSGL